MNGSANGFSSALFFALVAIGIILSAEGVIGWAICAVSSLIAALCLRYALMQTAEAAEEDHQRIEIQFQQLRHKVGESSASSTLAMHTITDTAEIVQDSLNAIRAGLEGLENLQAMVEANSAMGAALKNIEDSTKSNEFYLQGINENLEKNFGSLNKLSESISKNTEQLCNFGESNKASTQTVIKLMQVFGQMLKSPSFAKDISKLSESADKLLEKVTAIEDLKNILTESKAELTTLTFAIEEISKQNSGIIEVAEQLKSSNKDYVGEYKEVSGHVIKSAENLAEMFENVRKEISALTKKIEAYNGLTKATLEQYANLTEQDVRILEKIASKVNG